MSDSREDSLTCWNTVDTLCYLVRVESNKAKIMKHRQLLDSVVNIYQEQPCTHCHDCFEAAKKTLFRLRSYLLRDDELRDVGEEIINCYTTESDESSSQSEEDSDGNESECDEGDEIINRYKGSDGSSSQSEEDSYENKSDSDQAQSDTPVTQSLITVSSETPSTSIVTTSLGNRDNKPADASCTHPQLCSSPVLGPATPCLGDDRNIPGSISSINRQGINTVPINPPSSIVQPGDTQHFGLSANMLGHLSPTGVSNNKPVSLMDSWNRMPDGDTTRNTRLGNMPPVRIPGHVPSVRMQNSSGNNCSNWEMQNFMQPGNKPYMPFNRMPHGGDTAGNFQLPVWTSHSLPFSGPTYSSTHSLPSWGTQTVMQPDNMYYMPPRGFPNGSPVRNMPGNFPIGSMSNDLQTDSVFNSVSMMSSLDMQGSVQLGNGNLGNTTSNGNLGNTTSNGNLGNTTSNGNLGNTTSNGNLGNTTSNGNLGNTTSNGNLGNTTSNGNLGNTTSNGNLGNTTSNLGNTTSNGNLGNTTSNGNLGNTHSNRNLGNTTGNGNLGNTTNNGNLGNTTNPLNLRNTTITAHNTASATNYFTTDGMAPLTDSNTLLTPASTPNSQLASNVGTTDQERIDTDPSNCFRATTYLQRRSSQGPSPSLCSTSNSRLPSPDRDDVWDFELRESSGPSTSQQRRSNEGSNPSLCHPQAANSTSNSRLPSPDRDDMRDFELRESSGPGTSQQRPASRSSRHSSTGNSDNHTPSSTSSSRPSSADSTSVKDSSDDELSRSSSPVTFRRQSRPRRRTPYRRTPSRRVPLAQRNKFRPLQPVAESVTMKNPLDGETSKTSRPGSFQQRCNPQGRIFRPSATVSRGPSTAPCTHPSPAFSTTAPVPPTASFSARGLTCCFYLEESQPRTSGSSHHCSDRWQLVFSNERNCR
ncbi:dentin sialophosphoprotein-like [Littorina saxatilis]|uniref:dentin sialophosphoprotein-like n=1 Tax=Littorina saxatilis TaxID=31220 RepID=UPI0038B52A07